jgi:hypothetical protein
MIFPVFSVFAELLHIFNLNNLKKSLFPQTCILSMMSLSPTSAEEYSIVATEVCSETVQVSTPRRAKMCDSIRRTHEEHVIPPIYSKIFIDFSQILANQKVHFLIVVGAVFENMAREAEIINCLGNFGGCHQITVINGIGL